MNKTRDFAIAVLPGDGIGPEVVEPTLSLLQELETRMGGFRLRFERLQAGAAHYAQTGVSIPDSAMETARAADAILLGAMGMPHIRYPDGTEIAPQLELREKLHLFAGVRPIRTFAGLALPLASPRASEIDAVLVRESTEGLFASRNIDSMQTDHEVRDTMVVTRATSEKLFDFSFQLARQRKARGHPGRVTCIDKANVLRSMAFFRKIFAERAALFPDIEADYCYVDAAGLRMVKAPWDFDVMVTENMFGDILSDVGAGLMGGMGMAPSADVGERYAVFQPCHGSAPDITGQGLANPIATFLSAALMLEWLGDKHYVKAKVEAAQAIREAVAQSLAPGKLVPRELGGNAGTREISDAVMSALARG